MISCHMIMIQIKFNSEDKKYRSNCQGWWILCSKIDKFIYLHLYFHFYKKHRLKRIHKILPIWQPKSNGPCCTSHLDKFGKVPFQLFDVLNKLLMSTLGEACIARTRLLVRHQTIIDQEYQRKRQTEKHWKLDSGSSKCTVGMHVLIVLAYLLVAIRVITQQHAYYRQKHQNTLHPTPRPHDRLHNVYTE
jgi:hypothetical protein